MIYSDYQGENRKKREQVGGDAAPVKCIMLWHASGPCQPEAGGSRSQWTSPPTSLFLLHSWYVFNLTLHLFTSFTDSWPNILSHLRY